MKQKMKNIKYCVLCAFLLVGGTACNDSFEDHYSEESGVAPGETLWQLIEQDADLTTFKAIAEATGYDVLLKSNQSFTVFAPTNEALQGVDLTNGDVSQLRDIIRTHIARFKYTAGVQPEQIVYTINAKRIPFDYDGAKYTMKGSELGRTNLLASNGILHTVKAPIPFVQNVWEYMNNPELDSIRNFFAAFHTRRFVPGNSKIIDYAGGYAVYDSLFFETNAMWSIYSTENPIGWLNGIGSLNEEDSLYTMILPTNTAWRAAYAERFPYFETTSPNADSLQHLNTQYSIIQDLVFRGKIENPGQRDSLISTLRNVFHSPATLFSTATPHVASNGLVYTTNDLKYNYWESWQHPLVVEAERGIITLKETANVTPPKLSMVYLPAMPDIPSEYCVLISNGVVGKNNMTIIFYDVPNTLKATYNVYAVFAPMRYKEPETTNERAKIRYDIQQLDRSTAALPADKQVWKTLVGANVNGLEPTDQITDSIHVKKMLLRANFTVPEANYNEKTVTIRIKLMAQTAGVTESKLGFNNRMLLDKIIFEPVH